MSDDLSDLDLPAEAALGVWCDLERALAGKNSYGGDVAEIYAYRLVPPRIIDKTHPSFVTGATPAEERAAEVELARVAGANMTRILRHFATMHDRVIFAIEEREADRPLDLQHDEFPAFGWRVQLRVSQGHPDVKASSIHNLRQSLSTTVQQSELLIAALDELATYRAAERLRAAPQEPADVTDLPPDGATGLYLDRPFNATDLEWIKRAWDAYKAQNDVAARPGQLALVFHAIRRDARATAEFLRVMNTIILPICRRIRLKEQPGLSKFGALNE